MAPSGETPSSLAIASVPQHFNLPSGSPIDLNPDSRLADAAFQKPGRVEDVTRSDREIFDCFERVSLRSLQRLPTLR